MEHEQRDNPTTPLWPNPGRSPQAFDELEQRVAALERYVATLLCGMVPESAKSHAFYTREAMLRDSVRDSGRVVLTLEVEDKNDEFSLGFQPQPPGRDAPGAQR